MTTLDSTTLTERFRLELLADMPDRVAAIARLTAGLEPHSKNGIEELFRVIHNIKGSAGTFGMHQLVSICTPMEDLIQQSTENGTMNADFFGLMAEYLALLENTVHEIQQGKEDFERTSQRLASLHRRAFTAPFAIAVAVNSRMVAEMCRQIAQSISARIVIIDDSLLLLQRVLSEPFNLIIVSAELYPLRGEAVTAAAKLSHLGNRGIQTILLTSNVERINMYKRNTDPDNVVLRDTEFLSSIQTLILDAARRATATSAEKRQ